MMTTGAIRNTSTARTTAARATEPGPTFWPSVIGDRGRAAAAPPPGPPPAFVHRRGAKWAASSCPALEDALEADDAVVAGEADQRERQQDHRQGRGKRPVQRELDLALDQHRDHHVG